MTVKLVLTVITAFSMVFHPLHVSVCEIDLDTERASLEITTRIFIDDLEQEIRRELGNEDLDIVDGITDRKRDELVESYLKQHITIWLDGVETPTSYLGSEMESGAIYCYSQITGVTKLGKVGVKNDMLLRIFDDQVNLVHVSMEDRIKSLKMEGMISQGELEF